MNTIEEADKIYENEMKKIKIERLKKDIQDLEGCESPDKKIDERLRGLYSKLEEIV